MTSYKGSEMVLFGTIKAGGDSRPIVRCSVDGVPSTLDSRTTDESFVCAWKGDAGSNSHSFLLNVTIPQGPRSSPPSISIDSLWLHPSWDSTLSDGRALIVYDQDDPHVDLPSGVWQPLADNQGAAIVATQAGSSVFVSFTGRTFGIDVCVLVLKPSSQARQFLGKAGGQ